MISELRNISKFLTRSLGIYLCVFSCFIAYFIIFQARSTYAASACKWSATAASTNWANPANWTSCNGLAPQPADTAEIIASTNAAWLSTSVTIAGLTVTSGSMIIIPGGSLAVNGNILLTSGTLSVSASQTITLTGNWTNNGGTFSYNASTIIFNSTTSQQNINGTAVSQTFANITVNKSGQSLVVGGSTTTLNLNNGSMTLTSGTFNAGSLATINMITGDWTNNGGTFIPGTSRVKFISTTSQQNINGTAVSQSFYDLQIDKSSQSTIVGGSTTTLNITNSVILTSGTFNAGTATQINFSGPSWANTGGTFTPGTGNVSFTGTGSQSISGTAASQTFYDVTVAMTAGQNLSTGSNVTSLSLHNLTETTGNINIPSTLTTLNINNNLLINGGTFSSSANTSINIGGNWTNNNAFSHANGTVVFNGSGSQSIGGTVMNSFYNLTFNNTSGNTITTTNNPLVNNIFTLTAGAWTNNMISYGNVVVATTFSSATGKLVLNGTGNQTLTGSGVEGQGILPAVTIQKASGTLTLSNIITVDGAWNWISGSMTTTGSTVAFYDNNGSGYNITGNQTLTNVTFANNHNYVSGFYIDTSTALTVSGALAIKGSNYTRLSGNGGPASSIINAQGNITISNSYLLPAGATSGGASLQINGTGDQVFTGNSSDGTGVITIPITINKASGNLTLSSTISTIGAWTFTGVGTGSLITSGSTVAFYDNNGSGYNVIGTETLNNVIFCNNNSYVTLWNISNLTIGGTLIIKGTNLVKLGGGGNISGKGDISITNTYPFPTNQTMTGMPITLNGTGNQTITGSGIEGVGVLPLAIVINKPSGNLTLSGLITQSCNVSPCWTYTSMGTGNLITTGSTVAFYDSNGSGYGIQGSFSLNNLIFNNRSNNSLAFTVSNAIDVLGTLSIKGISRAGISPGVINAKGDIIVSNSGIDLVNGGSSGTININGTGNQTITGSGVADQGPLPNITINKPSGTLNLSSIITVTGDWNWTTGTLNAGSSTLYMDYAQGGFDLFTPGNVIYNNINFSPSSAMSPHIGGDLYLSGTLTKGGNALSTFSTNGGPGNNHSITSGSLTVNTGTFNANSSVITLSGNFSNTGIYNSGGSTLIFNGNGNSIIDPGSSSFYNLTSITPSKNLIFTKNNQINVTNNLSLDGQGCFTKIILDSSDGISQFNLNASGNKNLNHLSIKNSNAIVPLTGNSSTSVGNNSNWSSTVCDVTPPTITQINAMPSNTGALISWVTNENTSSKIIFGPNTNYVNSTQETNISPRVINHSITLNGLISCSNYRYKVKSRDAENNETISPDQVFTTSGCVGSANIGTQTATEAAVISGGTANLINNKVGITVNLPPAFSSTDATIQIKELDQKAVVQTVSKPSGAAPLGNFFYDLKAITDVGDLVSTFDKPLSVVLTYSDQDLNGMDASTLNIYRYDDSSWNKLTNCTVDTVTKTVTCETSHFSVFGLFGVAIQGSSENANSNDSDKSKNNPFCFDFTPSSDTNLFQADTSSTTTKLYFSPISNTSQFYISYSTNPNAEEHGALVNLSTQGIQNFTVNLLKPNTIYYFKVRSQFGCTPGKWSNILKVKTTNGRSVKKYYQSTTRIASTPKLSLANHIVTVNQLFVPDVTPVISTPSETLPSVTPKMINSVKKKSCFLWICW